MEKRRNRERGLLSLEASIALTIFIFLMLFLYSFFVVFEARNEMAHVLLSAADSLALDAYENETLGKSGTIVQLIYNKMYGENTKSDNGFTDHRSLVYETVYNDEETGTNKKVQSYFLEVVRTRFLAYLTNGDASKAEEILKRYHVKDGVNGLDFSQTKLDPKKMELTLSVRYKLEYEFQVFGGGEVEFEQKVCSKLWK